MQMSAVDLRITAHITHLGSHGAKTSVWSHSVAVEAAAMGGHTAPYDKMEPTSSVRRPESGTVWRWRQQQWEAVQGPMTHSGPGSSMRRRYRGP
ncbi:unnamed protein product [Staurois parvus]|uniref:Uncharacterized protein n=1 Tax=Staurois parvus TaxID=386267 RepID=A0ABN9HSU3_9NEOB|nr:unnamed protein product [Staurois parvus]